MSGKLGGRDMLAYTEELAHILKQFNASAQLALTERQVWRAICTLGKKSHRPGVDALLSQSIDSLILGIEHFNRPSERGRATSVMMMLDHSAELFLKAALLQRSSDIRDPKTGHTHSFGHCANRATDDGVLKFLSDDERRTLMVLNGLRDQAQHYLLDVSEQVLYTIAQSTVTLFAALLARVFGQALSDHVPKRVLPISVDPPKDINLLMDHEFSQLKSLLRQGETSQRLSEPRLRSLVAIDRALNLQPTQIPDEDLQNIAQQVLQSDDWSDVFHGISQIKLTTDGTGVDVCLHITKKHGIPLRLVTAGEAADAAIAVRRVNDTDFYCYSARSLASKVGLTQNKMVALIRFLNLAENEECFKEIKIGKSRFKRYSANALKVIKEALPTVDMDEVWSTCWPSYRSPTAAASGTVIQ